MLGIACARRVLAAGVSLTALGFAVPVLAQSASAPKSTEAAPSEIIVTAQKRSQNLQDVPVVVTVLNQKQLQDAGVHDIKGLTVLTPGLTVTSTGSESSTTARIRGVGTVADNIGLEDQVGIVVDGVPRPRNGVAFNDLGELADIEVLKGPQGTLFGANTTAGVINITTARPTFKPSGTAEATVGNYGAFGGAMSVNGPIIADTLAGRLYIAGRSRDGFYTEHNPQGPTPPSPGDEHFYTARGQLLWTPNNDFDVNFIADYTKRNDHPGGATPIVNGLEAGVINALLPGATATTPDPKAFNAYNNRANIENITDQGVSAEAHWKTPWFGGATLTSITSIRSWKDQSGSFDPDYTALDILADGPGVFTKFTQYTEELRLAGHADKLDWLVGGYIKREDLGTAGRLQYGSQYDLYIETLVKALTGGAFDFNAMGGITNPATAFPANEGTFDNYSQHEHSEALFTQETYKLTDAFEITAGLRYTAEHKTLDTLYTNTGTSASGCTSAKNTLGAAGFAADPFSGFYCSIVNDLYNNLPTHQARDESAGTGTIKGAYRFNRDLMAYASYSRGYLVGGFNLARTTSASASGVPNSNAFVVAADTSFRPTHVDAYEIGEKSTLFDRRLTLNGALFYQDYTDFQLNAFNGLVFVVTSVPEVISRGAELDASFRATHELTLNAGVTYSDTYYPSSGENRAALTAANGLQLLPGHRLSLAPSWSIAGGAAWQHPVTDALMLNATVDVKYVSSYNTGSDLDPNKAQAGFALVNTSVGIGPRDQRWQLSLWAQNLFNQSYYQVGFNGVDQTLGIPGGNTYEAFLGLPRTYGATMRVKF